MPRESAQINDSGQGGEISDNLFFQLWIKALGQAKIVHISEKLDNMTNKNMIPMLEKILLTFDEHRDLLWMWQCLQIQFPGQRF